MLHSFISANVSASKYFDRALPKKYSVDGNSDFRNFVGVALKAGDRIVDVGSGARPFLSPDVKAELSVSVVGMDISHEELELAPPGAYDESVVCDITEYRGDGDADVVIAQSVLEHVRDNQAALQGIASMLKPGGVALIFQPCRYAVFARINRLMPEKLKLKMLHAIYPQTKEGYGFPAFYDRCTPAQFEAMAQAAGMKVERKRVYYRSLYFSFFFPLHLGWRAWSYLYAKIFPDKGVETFALLLRKS